MYEIAEYKKKVLRICGKVLKNLIILLCFLMYVCTYVCFAQEEGGKRVREKEQQVHIFVHNIYFIKTSTNLPFYIFIYSFNKSFDAHLHETLLGQSGEVEDTCMHACMHAMVYTCVVCEEKILSSTSSS